MHVLHSSVSFGYANVLAREPRLICERLATEPSRDKRNILRGYLARMTGDGQFLDPTTPLPDFQHVGENTIVFSEDESDQYRQRVSTEMGRRMGLYRSQKPDWKISDKDWKQFKANVGQDIYRSAIRQGKVNYIT